MSDHFLVKFMRIAQEITNSERGFAVDSQLNVLDMINLTHEIIQTERFSNVATQNLQKALKSGNAILTNNIITDPSQAPVTNTNFSDLRVVIIIPVTQRGAIYLDQSIRQGIPHQSVLDKLAQLATYLLDNGMEDCSEAEIKNQYMAL